MAELQTSQLKLPGEAKIEETNNSSAPQSTQTGQKANQDGEQAKAVPESREKPESDAQQTTKTEQDTSANQPTVKNSDYNNVKENMEVSSKAADNTKVEVGGNGKSKEKHSDDSSAPADKVSTIFWTRGAVNLTNFRLIGWFARKAQRTQIKAKR